MVYWTCSEHKNILEFSAMKRNPVTRESQAVRLVTCLSKNSREEDMAQAVEEMKKELTQRYKEGKLPFNPLATGIIHHFSHEPDYDPCVGCNRAESLYCGKKKVTAS